MRGVLGVPKPPIATLCLGVTGTCLLSALRRRGVDGICATVILDCIGSDLIFSFCKIVLEVLAVVKCCLIGTTGTVACLTADAARRGVATRFAVGESRDISLIATSFSISEDEDSIFGLTFRALARVERVERGVLVMKGFSSAAESASAWITIEAGRFARGRPALSPELSSALARTIQSMRLMDKTRLPSPPALLVLFPKTMLAIFSFFRSSLLSKSLLL